MNGKIIVSTVAVAALVLGNGVLIKSQEAGNATAQEGASAQAEVGTQGEALAEGDATTEVTVLASLTAASRENVEVWRLTCTTTPIGFVQVARAAIRDRGGADGRRLYFHLKRATTGATVKRTATDGGISAFGSVGSGGAGSTYFIEVSKDRDALVIFGRPIAEPYTLRAECVAGGFIRRHTLALIQNR